MLREMMGRNEAPSNRGRVHSTLYLVVVVEKAEVARASRGEMSGNLVQVPRHDCLELDVHFPCISNLMASFSR